MSRPLTEGSLSGLEHRHLHSGKVRELYGGGDDQLLMVATAAAGVVPITPAGELTAK